MMTHPSGSPLLVAKLGKIVLCREPSTADPFSDDKTILLEGVAVTAPTLLAAP
jgi:hypothetical protein